MLNSLRPSMRTLLMILSVAVVYFVSARLSLLLAFQSSNATPVWPPSGIALAAVLLLGFRIWQGILIGAFAVNIYVFLVNKSCDLNTALWTSALIGIGNTSEALAGYYLLKRLYRGRQVFQKITDVSRFALVAPLMSLVSSVIGSAAVFFAGIIQPGENLTVWFTWWTGDLSGILILTPFIYTWARTPSGAMKQSKIIESGVIFLAVILISGMVFNNWFFPGYLLSRAFILIPVLLWAAIRLELREAATVLFLSSALIVLGTLNRQGPFANTSLNESLLTTQAFISINSIMILLLNAVIRERNGTVAILRDARNQLESRVAKRTAELESSHQQLQQQMEFSETMIDSSVDLIMSYDKNLRFLSFNKKCEEVYGLKKEEVIGKNIIDLFPKTLNTPAYQDMMTALSGQTVHNKIFPSFIMEGRYFENFLIPLKDHNQEVYGVLATAHDVTDQKKAEDEMKQMTRELGRSNQELENFAYIASHDLQEPLRAMVSYIQLLQKKYKGRLDEEADEFIGFAVDAGTRMHRLINALLSYSKVGAQKTEFEEVDFNRVLDKVQRNLAAAFTENKVNLNTSALPKVKADEMQMTQLFQNLLSNAIKFRNTDSPKIEITAMEEKHFHVFSVKDNGIGLPGEYRDKIFILFQRLHDRKKYPGTGMGLAISKKIVEGHGGTIWVESEEGKGSTFYFTIQK